MRDPLLTPSQAPQEHLPFGVPAATSLLHPSAIDVEGRMESCAAVVAAVSFALVGQGCGGLGVCFGGSLAWPG